MPEASSEALTASHVLEYPYTRSVGPVIGRFLTGLRERRVEGVPLSAGAKSPSAKSRTSRASNLRIRLDRAPDRACPQDSDADPARLHHDRRRSSVPLPPPDRERQDLRPALP